MAFRKVGDLPRGWALYLVTLLPFLASCAGLQSSRPVPERTTPVTTASRAEDPEVREEAAEEAAEPTPSDLEQATIEDIIRTEEPNTQTLYDNSHYDFPITINSAVEGWIDYFTGRGREHMERYLARSSRYIPSMKKLLKQEGLPEDLVYLALIESGFNLRAKSRARAVGPWQFMKSTGTRYGLRVDPWIDERRDPVHATLAAARYLKDLYLMFESWYLAAAAYNSGEYKILRAVESLKTNNFWAIRASRAIRRETKDYVPKLIAAAIIAKNPERYGFGDIIYEEPLAYDTVTVNFPIHLREVAKLVNEPVEDLEDLNPELTRSMVPPDVTSYEMRVPPGTKVLVERAVASIRDKLAATDIPKEHTVRPGETIHTIARKYRMRVADLLNLNNMGRREKLKPGEKILLPEKARAVTGPVAQARPSPRREAPKDLPKDLTNHKVRSGESLWSIALKYDVTIQEIFRWNSLDRSRIFPGMVLKVRAPAGGEAADEDREPAEGEGKDEPKDDAPKAQARSTPDPDGFVMHEVQPGESLWSISKDYDVSIRDIKKWNNMRKSRITAGKKLKIRSPEKSTVTDRETYFRPRRRSRAG